jgi:hypothetical protein
MIDTLNTKHVNTVQIQNTYCTAVLRLQPIARSDSATGEIQKHTIEFILDLLLIPSETTYYDEVSVRRGKIRKKYEII